MNKEQAIVAAVEIDIRYLRPNCDTARQSSSGFNLMHLRWMVEEIERGTMSEGKTMRWLGYLQGVMVGRYGATLEDMKDISRRAAGS